jgi:hypothetical protein
VLAWDGLLYVSAVYPTGVPATPFEGRLFELDPVGLMILRVSRGSHGELAGGGADDAGNFWVVSRAGGGTIGPALSKVPTSTFVAAQVPLVADPDTLTDPQWWSTVRLALGLGLDGAEREDPERRRCGQRPPEPDVRSGTAVGHVAGERALPLVRGQVGGARARCSYPADVSVSAVTLNVGGSPDGLLVLA